MTKEITNKTYCVMLRGGYKTYLTKDEAEFLSLAFESGKETVRINDKTFFKFGIQFILPAEEIDREERFRKGDYKCEYGNWHSKGEECACGEFKKYDNRPKS